MSIPKQTAFRSAQWREAAKGQPCSLQIPGVCNHDPETTVLAHLPSPMHGMAYKSDDWFAVDCCSACHDVIDGRVPFDWMPGERERFYLQGLYLTWNRRLGESIGC
ncbi:DUF1364 domain-containing protein [Parasalinivibrio latis]|uniref:nuclease domain-containing protein n=1 Tax=Parasalinivibrio latis TaxID=2952610 RepID=UPI0030E5646E